MHCTQDEELRDLSLIASLLLLATLLVPVRSFLYLTLSRNVIVNLKLLTQTLASLAKLGFLLIYIHVQANMFVLCICVYRLQRIQFPFLPLWVRSVY